MKKHNASARFISYSSTSMKINTQISLRRCRTRDLIGSQIPVTTEFLELQISCILSIYLTH